MKARIYTVLEIAFILLFLFSAYKLITIYKSYSEGDKIYEDSRTEFVKAPAADGEEPTFDIASLKELNSDALGWIYIENTPVNYPLMQTDNNEYYLKHTYNRKYSDFGSIFTDCRCPSDMTAKNTVIYGHNTKNGSMFGSLKKYKSEEYLKQHPYVNLVFENAEYKYKIISAFTAETSDAAYTLDFKDTEDFTKWLTKVSDASEVNTEKYTITGDEEVITLSTCTSRTKTERFIVIAVKEGDSHE